MHNKGNRVDISSYIIKNTFYNGNYEANEIIMDSLLEDVKISATERSEYILVKDGKEYTIIAPFSTAVG